MMTTYCHCTRKDLSTNIFDIMKFKILFQLNCDSPKYIAKLISLSISKENLTETNTENNNVRV